VRAVAAMVANPNFFMIVLLSVWWFQVFGSGREGFSVPV
jgi:hypothetical protein